MGCNGYITGIQYSPMVIFQNWGPKFSSKSNLLYPPVVKHGLLENCLYIVFLNRCFPNDPWIYVNKTLYIYILGYIIFYCINIILYSIILYYTKNVIK